MSTEPNTAAAAAIGNGSGSGQALDREPDSPQPHIRDRDASDAIATDPSSIAVGNPQPDHADAEVVISKSMPPPSSKSTGLHSPPDSNNVDGSTDSELSDLDEAIANADDMQLDTPPPAQAPPTAATTAAPGADPNVDPTVIFGIDGAADGKDQPEQVPTPEQDEDIGEVLPAEWSGTVPVFRPTMQQFKDFKKFVCRPSPASGGPCVVVRVLT